MMKPLALLLALSVSATLATPPLYAQPRASQTSALINQQLDKRIRLELNNSPLPAVLAQIEQQTGVPLRVSEQVYDLLPWGEQTPITATLEDTSLRDALTAISTKLGLRLNLRDEWLELAPHPALKRLGRRATLQELQALDLLGSTQLAPLAERPTLAALAGAIDAAIVKRLNADRAAAGAQGSAALLPNLVVELRRTDDVDLAAVTVMVPRGAMLTDALHAITTQTKLTWYPWGDTVVILPKREVVAKLLDRAVSMRYDGVDVAQVLADLSTRSGVDFAIEPGAIQRVTPEYRVIKLDVDASVRQALESLQGYTGLGYVITDDGVYVWNQNSSPAAAAGRGRVLATVDVGHGAQVLVYEDMLSTRAADALKARRDAAIGRIEADLTGIVPPAATQPADHHN